jgi:hypothetical protein
MTHLSTRWVKHLGFLLATLVVAVLLLRLVSSAQGTPRVHYRVLDARTADSASLEAELNEYGQAGWELVLIHIGNVTTPTPRFIFKRVEQP